MKIGLQRRNQLQGSGPAGQAALEEFQSLVGALAGWSRREHTDEGLHADITAQSVTVDALRDVALTVVSGLSSLGGGIAAQGALTPATITADTDNYSPVGIDDIFCLRVATDASRLLNGIQDGPRLIPTSGRLLMLFNAGSNNLVLVHEGLTSTAEFRFRLSGFANVTVEPNNCVLLYYDARARRWIIVASSGGGSGSIYSEFDAGNSGASITIDWAAGTQQILTLTANAALSFSNPVEGAEYRVVLVQDATGGRVPTYAANVLIETTALPAARTQAGDMVLLTLAYTAAGGGKYLAYYSDIVFFAGDVAGPAASVDKEIALFDGTTGKLLERATGTGIVRVTSGVYGAPGNVVESEITLADNTTNNASVTAHGFLKKLSNVATEYMDGTGAWSTPGGGVGGAPTGADYWVETADAGLSAEVVVGTTGITTAAYASRQAAAKAGRLFLPNNGFYLERDTGSAWAPWGPLFPMTPPVDGDFAWVNQGAASVDTTNGGIYLLGPATAGVNIRARVKTAPATPYTITAGFLHVSLGLTGADLGLVFRDSAGGGMHAFFLSNESSFGRVYSAKYTSATVLSAAYAGSPVAQWFVGGLVWLRITDNGTNRICSISGDGQHFIQFHTIGRTDFLTANQVGFFVNADQATYDVGMTLLSWKET